MQLDGGFAIKDKRILSLEESSRLVEMAWEDRTPIDAIARTFDIKVGDIPAVMRAMLKRRSYIAWKKRVRQRKTKHEALRSKDVVRHQSKMHNKYRP